MSLITIDYGEIIGGNKEVQTYPKNFNILNNTYTDIPISEIGFEPSYAVIVYYINSGGYHFTGGAIVDLKADTPTSLYGWYEDTKNNYVRVAKTSSAIRIMQVSGANRTGDVYFFGQ